MDSQLLSNTQAWSFPTFFFILPFPYPSSFILLQLGSGLPTFLPSSHTPNMTRFSTTFFVAALAASLLQANAAPLQLHARAEDVTPDFTQDRQVREV
jgi:hypothetical protein